MDGKHIKNKAFAEFGQSKFYVLIFKPYLQELVEAEQKRLELDVTSEFQSVKRDIELAKSRTLINKIIRKIEAAHEDLDKSIQEVQVSISKYDKQN